MKVLSLKQPHAGLCVNKHPKRTGALKGWETRSWKPTERNLRIIQKNGMLIHASKTWKKDQVQLMNLLLIRRYENDIAPLDFGAIIGWVRVGRILTTEEWKEEHRNKLPKEHFNEEAYFGDYSPNRFAWEFTEFKKLKEPIKVNGSLSLWDFFTGIEDNQFFETHSNLYPYESEFDEDDEIEFNPCDNCDLPDACADFGCAIQQGIRRPIEF